MVLRHVEMTIETGSKISNTPGRVAYKSYREFVGNKSWDGKPLKDFDEMSETIQGAWEKAGNDAACFVIQNIHREEEKTS